MQIYDQQTELTLKEIMYGKALKYNKNDGGWRRQKMGQIEQYDDNGELLPQPIHYKKIKGKRMCCKCKDYYPKEEIEYGGGKNIYCHKCIKTVKIRKNFKKAGI